MLPFGEDLDGDWRRLPGLADPHVLMKSEEVKGVENKERGWGTKMRTNSLGGSYIKEKCSDKTDALSALARKRM